MGGGAVGPPWGKQIRARRRACHGWHLRTLPDGVRKLAVGSTERGARDEVASTAAEVVDNVSITASKGVDELASTAAKGVDEVASTATEGLAL